MGVSETFLSRMRSSKWRIIVSRLRRWSLKSTKVQGDFLVTLKVPLAQFALARLGQGDSVALARVQLVGQCADSPTLTGGVATFDHHGQALARVLQPLGKIIQLDVHVLKLL